MVKSCNEWDTLKEVFVGNIENPNNPIKGAVAPTVAKKEKFFSID